MTELNPVIPKFFFKATFTRLQFTMHLMNRGWEGPLDTEEVIQVTSYLTDRIALSKTGFLSQLGRRALSQMLMQYIGRPGTPEVLSEIAWRSATCFEYFNEDKVPMNSFHVTQPAWYPFQIASVSFNKINEQHKLLLTLDMRVLSGIFGGLRFRQVVPYKFLIFKLAREIGSFGRDIPNPKEIAGYWMAGLLDTTNWEYPRVTDYRVTSACQMHNRMLRKLRDEPCPRKFTCGCVACPIGYDDKLPTIEPCVSITSDGAYRTFRPTHPKHYVFNKCMTCQQESLFDPDLRTAMCVRCQDNILAKHRRFG